MDYISIDAIMMFDECDRQICVNITIIQDLMVEVDESFTFHLRRTVGLSPRILLDPEDGVIEIVDDDGKECISFTDLSQKNIFRGFSSLLTLGLLIIRIYMCYTLLHNSLIELVLIQQGHHKTYLLGLVLICTQPVKIREVLRSVSSLVSLHQEEPHDHFLFHYQLRITLQVCSITYIHVLLLNYVLNNSVLLVSPADYVSVSSQVISFSTGDTSHTVTLSITNDEICEMTDESFSVSLSLLSGTAPITISPELAQVAISDTDEPECGELLHSST